ncbi:MAG: class I SAM-dependent methyltransferase [Planctomycetota bacterium]
MNDVATSRSAAEWHHSRYGSLDQGWVHRRERRLVAGLLAPLRGQVARCLDAPAGYGRMLEPVLEALAPAQVVCVDRHPARLGAVPPGGPVQRVRCDLMSPLPFAARSFDLVVCCRFLQHVRAPGARAALIARLAALCRGHLLLTYYERGTLHGLQRELFRRCGLRRGRPLEMVSTRALHDELAAAGLEVLEDVALAPRLHAQRLVLARVRG